MQFMKKILITFLSVLVLSLFAGLALLFVPHEILLGPIDPQGKIITVTKGQGLRQIAQTLADEKLIIHPVAFIGAAVITNTHRSIPYGEYLIPSHLNPYDILQVILSSTPLTYKLTIPEGLTVYQIVGMLNSVEKLEGIIKEFPQEGALFPQTYIYRKGDSKEQILKKMQQLMSQTLNEVWEKRQPDLPLISSEEALVLASIVEKETGVGTERGHIAGVFINRLNKKMKLQADPTVIYAITNGTGILERSLVKKDLQVVSNYNTYYAYGLPPLPICCPGKAAIQAVLNPKDTPDLYFVANGKGSHFFSSTLEDHNANVTKWRAIRDEKKE